MITLFQRLQEIKTEEKTKSSQKMIFLLNPKDTRILQALVAWKTVKIQLNKQQLVNQDCSLDEIWDMSDFSIKQYAITLGCTIQDALPRLKQLKNLSLIYPDGTINENARVLVSMYIKKKLSEVRVADE